VDKINITIGFLLIFHKLSEILDVSTKLLSIIFLKPGKPYQTVYDFFDDSDLNKSSYIEPVCFRMDDRVWYALDLSWLGVAQFPGYPR